MDRMETIVELNVFPLGSYDLLIGMDWLGKNAIFLNCRNTNFECLYEFG
jgi:hypothetical protein